MNTLWNFLQDSVNREVIGWLAGGVAVVVAGIWAVIKFRASKKEKKPKIVPTMSLRDQNVIVGRDMKNTSVNINKSSNH